MTDYCPTCKFYENIPNKKNGIGYCHRYPRIHLESTHCYYVDVKDKNDWCGEWRPIDKEIHIQ